ncbi:MAG TPA: response regulator [Actinomycetota bacterium]
MKALVVDDNEDLRFLIGRLLVIEGFEIAEAGDGGSAIAAIDAGPRFDLVLLDVQMPVVDGWHALEAIRGRAEFDDVRVVMCTVKGRSDDLIRGWELGCDGFIAKPFDIDAFRHEIREVMTRDDSARRTIRAAEIRRARAAASS